MWRMRALPSRVGMGTLTLTQNGRGEKQQELPIVVSKARNPDFYAKCSHF